jgi:peptidoglycan hydrolase-like protein with peptidoglycan-binding domain
MSIHGIGSVGASWSPEPPAELESGALKDDATLAGVASGAGAPLGHGSRGPTVRTVQQALIDLGYELPRWGADGDLGNETAAALRTFQSDAGISLSGEVDQATVLAMDAALVEADAAGGATGPGSTHDGTTVEGSAAEGIQNPRFTDPTLSQVADGRRTLGPGARGPAVTQTQQALLDLGFDLPIYGADGAYGREMSHAVKAFQLEVGLEQTGRIDEATMEALDRVAPPPGKVLERTPDYDALYADNRLDMTIAFGYDEHGTTPGKIRDTMRGLQDQGFRIIDPEYLPAAERERLGLGPDRYTPGATYYHRRTSDPMTNEPLDEVVRLITPDSADDPRDIVGMFKSALAKDDVVIYNGHARYGTGPDFDDIHSGAGNFVINEDGNPPESGASRPPSYLADAIRSRDTDLDEVGAPGKYQLLLFNACSTETYLPHLRREMSGRDTGNTDIVATTLPTYLASGAQHVLGFVDGVTNRRSMNEIEDTAGATEQYWVDRFDDRENHHFERAGAVQTSSGFIGNRGNRLVDRR